MTLNEYQGKAWAFMLPPAKNFEYLLPGITAEVGELNELFAKAIRKDGSTYEMAAYQNYEQMLSELGDILFFVSAMAGLINSSLTEIACYNLSKLKGRKLAGTIDAVGERHE